jgi:hypothetical protein
LAQNSNELAFSFIEKYLFATKTGWKSIFHLRETHILARLDIMVLYIFFQILKNIEFQLKTQMGYPLVFLKMYVHDENGSKSVFLPREAHILAQHYGDVHKFFEVLRNIKFRLET